MLASKETIVFVALERESPGDWARYRGLFQSLRHRYPVMVLNKKSKGRVKEKIVAFLKRHEAVWMNMYRLLGWKVAEINELGQKIAKRYEMPIEELRKLCEELKKLQEALKSFEKIPEWLAEHVKPRLFLGDLALDKLLGFFELVEKKFVEYAETPKAFVDRKAARTSFHNHLRASRLLALVITAGSRDGQYNEIRKLLYEVLRMGVVPLDYSYDSIIVAKRVYRRRGVEKFWGSTTLDPEYVLKRLEARPYYAVVECKGIDFEKRDVGWGLRSVASGSATAFGEA